MLSYVFTTSSAATVVPLSKVEQQKAMSPDVAGVTYDTALFKSPLFKIQSSWVVTTSWFWVFFSNHVLPLTFYTVSRVTYSCSPPVQGSVHYVAKGYVTTVSGNGKQLRLTLKINSSGIFCAKIHLPSLQVHHNKNHCLHQAKRQRSH